MYCLSLTFWHLYFTSFIWTIDRFSEKHVTLKRRFPVADLKITCSISIFKESNYKQLCVCSSSISTSFSTELLIIYNKETKHSLPSVSQRWEFLKENKKTRTRPRKRQKKLSFFSWSLSWSSYCFFVFFLFYYFLVFFYKFPI